MSMENIDPRILLVEDDHEIRALLGMILSQEGHTYRETCNGAEALQYLEGRKSERKMVAFVDVRMPVLDGLSFVTEAQKRGLLENIKVFFLTSEPLAPEVELAGVKYPVLSKLMHLDRLLDLVDHRS